MAEPTTMVEDGNSQPEVESFAVTRLDSGEWTYNDEQQTSVATLVVLDVVSAINLRDHGNKENYERCVAAVIDRLNQTLDYVHEQATPPRISDLTVRCRMITKEWLLSLGCKWCPCNIHGTPDTDLLHPSGLQFWGIDDAKWGCVDPQAENLRTCGDVLDLIRLAGY